MRYIVVHFGLLLCMLVSSSCGKRSKISGNSKKSPLGQSEAGVYFNTLNKIKKAIIDDDFDAFKKTILANPLFDLNQSIVESGETFLTLAIKLDRREIRNHLIDKQVDLDKFNINKETPLIAAVTSNQVNSVQVLIDLKVDLERKDSNGNTALLIALKNSLDEISLMLIKNGANIHAQNYNDKDAFRLAIEHNNTKSIELIKEILNLEFGTPDLTTYKKILSEGDHKRLSRLLGRYPKIATDEVYDSINPFVVLVEMLSESSAYRSAEILISYNANINGPIDAIQTPLIKATIQGKMKLANLFLSSNANPQLVDSEGKSALMYAVEMNDFQFVELLLSYSADESYTIRKEGKKISYNACTEARKARKNLTNETELITNDRIKKILRCGILGWFI